MKWLVLLLGGCAMMPELETGPKVERVLVPVQVSCISVMPVRPAPIVIDPNTASRTQVAAAVAAYLIALDVYAKQAEKVMLACTDK